MWYIISNIAGLRRKINSVVCWQRILFWLEVCVFYKWKISAELLYVYIMLYIMRTFTKINSFAYLSQKLISSLVLSGVKLRQLWHWYSNIGDQDIEFGQWLVQQDFDTFSKRFDTGMDDQILKLKKRRSTIYTVSINTLFFILTLIQSLFWVRKINFALCKRCRKPCRF